MDRQLLGTYYEKNVGLIHSVAQKGFRRLQAIGAVTDYDDLFQELVVTFINSYDLFDESKGMFSTYFIRSAFNKLNKIAKGFEAERIENGVRSIEELSSFGPDGVGFEDLIPSSFPTPEEFVSAQSMFEAISASLSPLATMIAEMAIDPPEFIEHEFNAAIVHAERSRNNGVEKRARGSLNVAFVCHVLTKTTELTPSSIRSAKSEIFSTVRRLYA
jgi:hypothetical protein